MIPRVGEAVRSDRSYRLRPGAYAILLRGRHILLTHQSKPEPEVQLPGGGIDPGEHVLPALRREVMEETGWSMTTPRRLGAYRRFVYMPEYDLWAEKLCTVFLARPARRHNPPIEPHHTALWRTIDEAVEMLASDGDRLFLSRLRDRIGAGQSL